MTNPYTSYEFRTEGMANPIAKNILESSDVVPVMSVFNPAPSFLFSEDVSRIGACERRLSAAELSHGSLAQEVHRLREELRSQMARRDVREAAAVRRATEFAIRASGDSVAPLAAQVQALADRQSSDAGSVALLRNLVRTLEHSMAVNQRDVQHKIDSNAERVNELRDAFNEMRLNMTSDQRHNRATELKLLQNFASVKKSVDRCVDGQRGQMEGLDAKWIDLERKVEREGERLRGELADRTEQLVRRFTEYEIQHKEECQGRLSDAEKKFQSTQKDLDAKWKSSTGERNLTHLMEDRKKMKSYMKRIAEAISLLEKQLEEQRRLHEKLMAAEIETRVQRDRQIQSKFKEVEEKILVNKDRTQKITADHPDTVTEATTKEHLLSTFDNLPTVNRMERDVLLTSNVQENLAKIDEFDAWRKHVDPLISKNRDAFKRLSGSVENLENEVAGLKSLSVAGQSDLSTSKDLESDVAELRTSVGKIAVDVASLVAAREKLEKGEEEPSSSVEKIREKMRREAANAGGKVEKQEGGDGLDGSAAEDAGKEEDESSELRQTVDKLQSEMSETVASLSIVKDNVNDIVSTKIPDLEENQNLLSKNLDRRLKEEVRIREKEIDVLKKRAVKPSDSGAKQESPKDVGEMKEDIRKLAETIQIVKTVTGLKIQAEHRSRVERCQEIEEDVEKLKTELEKMRRDTDERN